MISVVDVIVVWLFYTEYITVSFFCRVINLVTSAYSQAAKLLHQSTYSSLSSTFIHPFLSAIYILFYLSFCKKKKKKQYILLEIQRTR